MRVRRLTGRVSSAREWLLPRDERAAARAERRTERTLRRQRDNLQTPERRRAALDAEARRDSGLRYGGAGR